MKNKHIKTKETDKIIQSLTPKDSHNFDEISNRIFKISAPFIVSNNIQIGVNNKILPNVTHTKFLGLITDNPLNWKNILNN
jgi:hypothetical protein